MKRLTTYLRWSVLALGLFLLPFGVQADVASDSILMWWVYDNYDDPMVPDTNPADLKYIDELLSRPDGYSVNGARLRLAGTDTYLNLYENADGAPLAHEMLPIAKDQSGFFTQAGPVWSMLGAYATTEYAFLVELGHWGEDNEWTVMATSVTASFDDLRKGGWTTYSMYDNPRQGPWTPTFAVPEPTSGLLVAIGVSLLALRRRQMTEYLNV